ncbi:MAG: hypothetical protein QM296_01225, partial [Bacillota bacterium]|nr:hypothetical protein [Bacillota bacterium]
QDIPNTKQDLQEVVAALKRELHAKNLELQDCKEQIQEKDEQLLSCTYLGTLHRSKPPLSAALRNRVTCIAEVLLL